MENNMSIEFTLEKYLQKILERNDFNALECLTEKVKKGHLSKSKYNSFFLCFVKIYNEHLDNDFKFESLFGLTKMVIYYEVEKEQINFYSFIFIHSIESSDLDFKKQGSRAITELIHRNYDLISQDLSSLIYNKLYALYLLSDQDPDVKDNILWGINRLLEVRLIPQNMLEQLYLTFLELAKSEDNLPTGVLRALVKIIEERIGNNIDYKNLLDVFKKYVNYENKCNKRNALDGISSLIEYHLIEKQERENLVEFLMEATQYDDKISQGNALACIYYLVINDDINQENKEKVINLLNDFQQSDYAYSKHNAKRAFEELTKIKSDPNFKKHKTEIIIHKIKSPFEFPIKVSSGSEDVVFDFALSLDNIRQNLNNEIIKLRLNIHSINQIENNHIFLENKYKLLELHNQIFSHDSNDPDCIYLLHIIENYKSFPKSVATPLRFHEDDLLSYFEAFITCKNIINNDYTLSNFHILLKKIDHLKKAEFKAATMSIILKCFNKADFYISQQDELILRSKVKEIYPKSKTSLDYLDIILANSRQKFINMNDSPIENEHDILKDARIRMSTFTEEKLIIDENNYKYIAVSNLLGEMKDVNQQIDISIRRLIMFRAHIISPGMIIFGVNIKQLQELELSDIYNNFLAAKLINDGYLDYGRNLNLDIGNKKTDKDNFIKACIAYTIEFLKESLLLESINLDQEVFKLSLNDNLDKILESRQAARKLLQGYLLKDAVAMLFSVQREQQQIFISEKYKACLLDSETNKSIRYTLRDLTKLTLKLSDLFTSNNGLVSISGYRKTAEIAEELTAIVEKGKSLIIPCGNPIKPTDKESKHFFYILIKNYSEKKVKLIIVNGGDNIESAVDIDNSFSDIDSKSSGSNWLCRETEVIDLSQADQHNFIKEYIHRALILPYTHFVKDEANPQNRKTLLENINLLASEFTGFGYIRLSFVPKILPSNERSYSMPSQLFGNCTIYNLQFAIRFLFDWNEAQFTQFIHDTYIRYNCFLHQKVDKSVLYYKEANHPPGAHSMYQLELQDLQREKVNFGEKISTESQFVRIRSRSFESVDLPTKNLYYQNKLPSSDLLFTTSIEVKISKDIAFSVLASAKILLQDKNLVGNNFALEDDFITGLSRCLRGKHDSFLELINLNSDLKTHFIRELANTFKNKDKLYIRDEQFFVQQKLEEEGENFFNPLIIEVKMLLSSSNRYIDESSGEILRIMYVNNIHYDSKNLLLYQDELLYEAGQIGGIKTINNLIDLGEDYAIAKAIIDAAKEYGAKHALNIIFVPHAIDFSSKTLVIDNSANLASYAQNVHDLSRSHYMEGDLLLINQLNTAQELVNSLLMQLNIDIGWVCKTMLYRNDIIKFNAILRENNIDRSINVLQDYSDFRKSVLLKLHPDKGGNNNDFIFIKSLQEKFSADLNVNKLLTDYMQEMQTAIYKAGMGFKMMDTVVDTARLIYEPTIAHSKKLAFDTAYLYSMYYGVNGYSSIITGADVLYQTYQGEYTQALTQALTSASYMALPVAIGYLGMPYLGFAYGVTMTAYTGYSAVANMYSFYQEYGAEILALRSAVAYKDLSQALAASPLQYLYDFAYIAKDYTVQINNINLELEKAAIKVQLDTKGEFGLKLYDYIYAPALEEKYELLNQVLKGDLIEEQAESLKAKHIKITLESQSYQHCMEIKDIESDSKAEQYYCYNEEQQILNHIAFTGDGSVEIIERL